METIHVHFEPERWRSSDDQKAVEAKNYLESKVSHLMSEVKQQKGTVKFRMNPKSRKVEMRISKISDDLKDKLKQVFIR